MDKQCPLCGKPMSEHESFCSDCCDNAKKRTSLNFLPEETVPLLPENGGKPQNKIDEDIKAPEENTGKKKRKTRKIFVILAITSVLIITVGIGIVFFTNEEAKNRTEELSFWYKCIEKNTPLAYSDYLLAYPEGEFQQQARRKIAELRRVETNERAALTNVTDLDAYYSFLNKYPDSPFRKEVMQIMDSLSWSIAQNENTVEAYSVYINNSELNNIAGEFIAIAKGRYRYLTSLQAVDAEELLKVRKAIENYFSILSGQEYDRFPELFTTPISNFYGQKNLRIEVLVKSIQADMEKNKVKSLAYTPDLEGFIAHKDTAGGYLAHLPVEKSFTYNIKDKKPESVKEFLHLKLTADMKVTAMFINEDKKVVW